MTRRVVKLCALLFTTAGAVLPTLAQAQTGIFRVYAGLAPTNYTISFDSNAIPGYENKKAKSNYIAANLGGTWVSSLGIYVDVSAQNSLSATHDLWSDSTVSDPQDFAHDVYTLTGGYVHVFGSGVSLFGFGGYTKEKTTLNAPSGASTPGLGTLLFSKDIFESSGIFIGAGGGIPALGGQFSGSAAIAGMKGTWKDDNGFEATADTTFGFSLGGAYSYKITNSLGVTGDLRYQQYKYNFGVSTSVESTVTEKVASLGVRLSYQF